MALATSFASITHPGFYDSIMPGPLFQRINFELISKNRPPIQSVWVFVVPAWIAGIQKPRMAFTAYIPVAWIPAIHAGMTPSRWRKTLANQERQ